MVTMAATKVELTGLAGLVYGIDPEPEFVAINEDNLLVVTLQENNGIVMIDCATKQVVNSFSAGSVDLSHIDVDEEDVISQTKSLASVRIPALCSGRCGRRLGGEGVPQGKPQTRSPRDALHALCRLRRFRASPMA